MHALQLLEHGEDVAAWGLTGAVTPAHVAAAVRSVSPERRMAHHQDAMGMIPAGTLDALYAQTTSDTALRGGATPMTPVGGGDGGAAAAHGYSRDGVDFGLPTPPAAPRPLTARWSYDMWGLGVLLLELATARPWVAIGCEDHGGADDGQPDEYRHQRAMETLAALNGACSWPPSASTALCALCALRTGTVRP